MDGMSSVIFRPVVNTLVIERYLFSSFPLRDKTFYKTFKEELKKKHPYTKNKFYIKFNHKYKEGRYLSEIPDTHPLLEKSFYPLGTDYPLYFHQEQALTKVSDGKNVLISTGTGSGKTEAFLLPILNHLLKEIENNTLGKPGVRALILYPLNALVNDQLNRIRDLLSTDEKLKQITFGMYIGETPENYEDIRKYKRDFYSCCDKSHNIKVDEFKCCENFLLTREEIRENPPHILITNYSMLEYLLARPKDLEIFSPSKAKQWQFLVLDEAHVYNGALAIEISMLIRKLKLALHKDDSSLQCIATSATIVDASTEEGKEEFIKFGTTLFGENFDKDSLVFSEKKESEFFTHELHPNHESLITIGSYEKLYNELFKTFVIHKIKKIKKKEEKKLLKILKQFNLSGMLDNAILELSERFYPSTNKDVFTLLRYMKNLEQNESDIIFNMQDCATFLNIPKNELQSLVAILNIFAQIPETSKRFDFFNVKFHQFVAANTGLFVTFKRNKFENIYFDPILQNEDSKDVHEIASCMRCGQEYLRGFRSTDKLVRYKDDIKATELVKDLFAFNIEDIDEKEFEKLIHKQAEEDGIKASLRKFCLNCNKFFPNTIDKCDLCSEPTKKVLEIVAKSEEFGESKCIRCGAKRVTPFKMGVDAVQSALIMAMYPELLAEKEARKLITFADSRKDAAFFPIALENRFNIFYRRAQIYRSISEEKLRLDKIGEYFLDERDPKEFELQVTKELFRIDKRIDLEASSLIYLDFEKKEKLMRSDLNRIFKKCTIVDFVADLINSYRIAGNNVFHKINTASLNKDISYIRIKNKKFTNLKQRSDEEDILIYDNKNIAAILYDKYVDNGFLDRDKNGRSFTEFIIQLIRELYFSKLIAFEDEEIEDYEENLEEDFCLIDDGFSDDPDFFFFQEKYFSLVKQESKEIYQCDICRSIQTTATVCVEKNCKGKMSQIHLDDIKDENYRVLYTSIPKSLNLKAEEHSGQLSASWQRDVQEKFKNGKVNILSSSTTFEMGVDLGALDAVFMRNMPPKTSNYQQRAGRAGRRKRNPYILTFAKRSSHDLGYFKNDNPKEMIAGEIISPMFNLTNTKIISRHVYSIVFSKFFKIYPEYFYNDEFPISYKFFIQGGIEIFRSWVEENIDELSQSIDSLLNSIDDEFFIKYFKSLFIGGKWFDDSKAAKNYAVLVNVIEDAKKKYDHEFTSIYQAFNEYLVSENSGYANDKETVAKLLSENGEESFRKNITFEALKELANRNMLLSLSTYGLIPKYGFPVDVVSLHFYGLMRSISGWKKYGSFIKKIDLSRDIKYAITEFAPGQDVIVNKRVVRSSSIVVPNEELKPRYYNKCEKCSTTDFFHSLNEVKNCINCGAVLESSKTRKFIIPVYGFDVKDNPKKVVRKPKSLYTTEPYINLKNRSDEDAKQIFSNMSLQVLKNTEIYLINRKEYRINIENGEIIKQAGSSRQNIYNIGANYSTDILKLTIPLEFFDHSKLIASGYSTGYALIEGLSKTASINRDDLDVIVQPTDNEMIMYIFDNVPGGAGHTYKILDLSEVLYRQWFERSFATIKSCDCAEDSACFKCLHSRGNQRYHSILERGLGIESFRQILQ